MIALRQIISGSAGLIFAIFASNDRYLFVHAQSGPFFQFLKDMAMATNFGQIWQNYLHSAGWCSETARNMAV